MKKIFTLFAALACVMSMSAVTYNVTVPAGTKACYIAGGMNSWSFTEMTKVDDTHYTLDLPTATEAMKYKYCSGPGWAYVEKDASGNEIGDRTYSATDVVKKWASVYEPSATPEEPKEEINLPEAIPAAEVDANSSAGKAVAYLTQILNGLGCENVTVSAATVDNSIYLQIDGEKLGVVIGRRGETLDAIQYLTRLVINRGSEDYKRVSINVGNYREKRKETLEALAVKTANRVLKQGRRVTLEPMNPYERRIIHSKVAEIEGVFSNSIGEEPFRKVVISANAKPSYNKGERRGRNHTVSAGKSYRQSTGFSTSFEREYKRTQSEPVEYSQETVDMEKDTALYGKIEL